MDPPWQEEKQKWQDVAASQSLTVTNTFLSVKYRFSREKLIAQLQS